MSIFFITGTGTDVGKTIATASLASYMAPLHTVRILKPFQTGTTDPSQTDAHVISKLSGIQATDWYRYRLPLAPWTAGRLDHQELPSVQEVAERLYNWYHPQALHLVEGAGGVVVPLGNNAFNLIDLADETAKFGISINFLVVVQAGLGALNTAMLTVNAITAAGHYVAGLVIGNWPAEPGLAERTNAEDFPELTNVPLVGCIPQGVGKLEPQVFANLAPTWFTDQAQRILLNVKGIN